jgi:hypothetical protein
MGAARMTSEGRKRPNLGQIHDRVSGADRAAGAGSVPMTGREQMGDLLQGAGPFELLQHA